MENPIVTIEMENGGVITAELYPEVAPQSVYNFISLANHGFYDGLIFHRVIPGFMIQGGGYGEGFAEKDAPSIYGEFAANGFGANDLHHAPGVLSMARTSDPNSASSQFFIMHGDARYLDGQYAGFGAVTDGMDVVNRIAATPTGRMGWFEDVPRETVRIEKIERV